jgi:hypothetical protein
MFFSKELNSFRIGRSFRSSNLLVYLHGLVQITAPGGSRDSQGFFEWKPVRVCQIRSVFISAQLHRNARIFHSSDSLPSNVTRPSFSAAFY